MAASLDTLWCTRYASTIWLPTVYSGCSEDCGSWNTIATASPRTFIRSLSGNPTISSPPSRIDPVIRVRLRSCRPITAMLDTDLPDPDSPTIASVRPSGTE